MVKMIQITEKQFQTLFPSAKDVQKWTHAINIAIQTYDLSNLNRVAMFLAQCGHESGGFTIFRENLNYQADGLRKVFPKYFADDATAARYARQPVWIASRVYAGRMGNGSEASQDGWKYRGIGCIQITGKQNISNFQIYLYNDDTIIQNVDLLTDPDIACHAAGWFWTKGKLNPLCDKDDVTSVTKIINGGKNGLDERTKLYGLAKKVLST